MDRIRPLALTVIVLAVICSVPGVAAEWHWLSGFTDQSSPEHIALYEELNRPRLEGVLGVPVQDVHWTEEGIDVHLKSGTVYLEPDLEGASIGAFFVGEATVTVAFEDRQARDNLNEWLSMETLDALPVSEIFFFTLHGKTLLEQLGVDGEATEPLQAADIYQQHKLALAQKGMGLLHAFLNREGRCRETAMVLFAPEFIRATGSKSAYLLYTFEPTWKKEIRLAAFGNKDIVSRLPHRFRFYTLANVNSERLLSRPHGKAKLYSTKLNVGTGTYSAEEESTIRFAPIEGLHALRLEFTPEMVVNSVTGPGGEELPFLQWKYLTTQPNFNQVVLVPFPEPPEPGKEIEITVRSAGSLFEPVSYIHWLKEEDTWHPQIGDPDATIYETFLTVPKSKTAVSSGELISDEVRDGKRHYHYRTPRPVDRTTLYFGPYNMKSEMADDTRVEVYVQAKDLDELKNHKFVLTEICNMVKFYNRRLIPLETDVIRVASTPTSHGRGFDGIILLSEGGFHGESSSDTFRAHEVAHQWWGNMVQTENWPEDRWLSEAFADFVAMEYYRIRFEKPEKLKDQMYREWVRYYIEPSSFAQKNVAGEKIGTDPMDSQPIIDGGQNVYSKGPAVLNMLRYTFLAKTGDDEVFWNMLKDFLTKYKFKRASSQDFMDLAEEHIGVEMDWFWDQWIYGRRIPEVTWSHTVSKGDGGWLLTVNARQTTDYTLVIPIYVRFGGDQMVVRPLVMEGTEGTRQLLLPAEPRKVSLNDYYESLALIKH